jgi:hypothetical protein
LTQINFPITVHEVGDGKIAFRTNGGVLYAHVDEDVQREYASLLYQDDACLMILTPTKDVVDREALLRAWKNIYLTHAACGDDSSATSPEWQAYLQARIELVTLDPTALDDDSEVTIR